MIARPSIQKHVVKSFGEVVTATGAKLLPYLKTVNAAIEQIHYQHGHPLEIVNTLSNMNLVPEFQVKKYPLVALFQDFTETKGKAQGYNESVRLNWIVANQTIADYKAKDRYEHNFDPILQVIYEEMLRQLAQHPDFVIISAEQIEHDKIDRLYWGKYGLYGNTGNTFNDLLDCIEVQGMLLTVKKTKHCLNNSFKTF